MNVNEGTLKDEIMGENQRPAESLTSPNTTPILPPEIWVKVFEYLSPEDCFSVINTCPEFNKMLANEKTRFLFPQVASILVRKVDSKTILACRLVNKETKTAVDATLKDEFTSPDKTYRKSHLHRRDKKKYYDRLKKFEDAFTFWERREVVTFLNKFGDRNEDNNPIITGKLTLGIKANLLITNDRTFPCLKRLLTKFGHLVEHIHIVVGNLGSVDNLVETTAQNKLRAVLRLVRNLKVLSLSSALGVFTDKYIGFMLPKLNKLEYIEFCSEFPRNFVLSFLGCYGEQLTILNCEGKLLNLREHTSCYLKKLLPNVQKVCVNEISVDGLQKLVDVRWPLKHLRIRSFHTSERPTWEDFTYFISPFSKFLVELDILDFTFHKFSEKRSKTVLPEFKKLSFVCTRMEYLYSLEFQNFLSRCPALYGLKVEQPEWTNVINCNTNVEKAKELLSKFKQLWEVVLFHYTENSRNSIYRIFRTLHQKGISNSK